MANVRLLDIEKRGVRSIPVVQKFKSSIFGQPEAVNAFTDLLEKFTSGMYDRTKPIGSLLFLGPTGSGKTASVEAFVEGLFEDRFKMLKIDCAEFQHSHEIAKLIGSPPGYLGHRETKPMFTNERMKELRSYTYPFTVILFDEIEKASDSLWNLLLGILDKGTLTTGTNEVVDMRETIIVMTSNVGSKEMSDKTGESAFGFQGELAGTESHEDIKRSAHSAAKKKFLPEFLNRLDDVVVFKTLSPETLREILFAELAKLQISIKDAVVAVRIVVGPSATEALLKEGYDRKYNARHLKRAIDRHVTLPLSRAMSSEQLADGDKFIVDYHNGKFLYHAHRRP